LKVVFGKIRDCPKPAPKDSCKSAKYGTAGSVAEVALSPVSSELCTVDAAGENCMLPHTSQSPAGRFTLVQLAGVPDVSEIAEALLVIG